MNVENLLRFAMRHCPGGTFGRIGLGLLFLSIYFYALSFMFMIAFILAALGSLYLSSKSAWISANSLRGSFSRALGFSGNVTSLGLYAGSALIFLLYCEFLLLLAAFAAPELGLRSWSAVTIVFVAISGKLLMLPSVLLLGSRREPGGNATEPSVLSYLKIQAFDDIRYALADCWRRVIDFVMTSYNWIVAAFFRGKKIWFLWPLGLAGLFALITPITFSAALLASIAIFHAGAVFLLRAFAVVLAPALARIRNR